MTDWISLIFVVLAILIGVFSRVWFIIAAFRVSLLWGLLVLFVPFLDLMFLIVHWDDAKRPFLCGLLALTALIPPIILNREKVFTNVDAVVDNVLKEHGQVRRESPDSPKAVLARKQAALLEHANEMNARYADLIARQKILASATEEMKAAFEADTKTYAALRKQVEAEKAEVEALQAAEASKQ